jgi:hypothetical protein
MKPKSTLILFLAGGAAYLALTSYAGGPGNGGLGDLSAVGCSGSGCHSASNSATVVHPITLVDYNNGQPAPAGKYEPGKVYHVTVRGTLNPANASLTDFGFQTTARNASNATVGTILLVGTADVQTYTANGRTGVEHNGRIPKSPNGDLTTFWRWTAPPAGTGTVTFRTALNAVNGNSDATGDQPNVGTTVFTEASLSVDDVESTVRPILFPNPAKDRVGINTRNWSAGTYQITLFRSTGGKVLEQSYRFAGRKDAIELELPDVVEGLYFLRIQGEASQQCSPLLIR